MPAPLSAPSGVSERWLPLLWWISGQRELDRVRRSLLQVVSEQNTTFLHIAAGLITCFSVCCSLLCVSRVSSRIEVRLGEHHIQINEGTEQVISSSQVIRHPNYDSYNIDNDIMLIKLSKPATLNQYVRPVALPRGCAPAGTMCKVSGWGNTMSSSEC